MIAISKETAKEVRAWLFEHIHQSLALYISLDDAIRKADAARKKARR